MTQKRFSATQYALFSSLFGLPRLLCGPISGFTVYAVGWTDFFWFSIAAGIPGLVMLSRFVPWREREPVFEVEHPTIYRPLTRAELALRGLAGTVIGAAVAALTTALLAALRAVKEHRPFDLGTPLADLLHPAAPAGWLTLLGILVFALVCGLFTAAAAAARHGAGAELADEAAG
jgi:PAT family beta-lactamase induction signal transducer AmpG